MGVTDQPNRPVLRIRIEIIHSRTIDLIVLMPKRRRRQQGNPSGIKRKEITRQPYTKFANFDPVLTSGYCQHLSFKWKNLFLKMGGDERNPYKDRAMGFNKWWRQDLARVSGNGMPGTATLNGKLIIAYIGWRCLSSCGKHFAFTDIGCAEVIITSHVLSLICIIMNLTSHSQTHKKGGITGLHGGSRIPECLGHRGAGEGGSDNIQAS